MATKMNKASSSEVMMCFAPEGTPLVVTAAQVVDVEAYSVICFDTDSDLVFNGAGATYNEWPAHQQLQIAPSTKTITFASAGTLLYMSL